MNRIGCKWSKPLDWIGGAHLRVRFLDEVAKDFQPNLIIYGTITNGLCLIGNMRVAILLLKDTEQVGSYQSSIVVYNTIIDSLCNAKEVCKTFKIFSGMTEKGTTPDVVTCSSLNFVCFFSHPFFIHLQRFS